MDLDITRHLAGKTALVTGSARGLGRAIALRLAKRGARIALNYVRDEKSALRTLAEVKALDPGAICVQADVALTSDINRLFDTVMSEFGRIDIVVANAGIEKVNIPVVDVTEHDFDELFRINTKGPYFVMQAAARRIADGGRILSISSSSTVHPQPGLGLYGTSKTARGITVNSLAPGPIDGAGIFTGIADDDPYKASLLATVPVGRLARPDDVADFVDFLVSDRALFITGEEIVMNGGASN